MIAGTVTAEGIPIIDLPIAGHNWTAIIDTGFNGDLELPAALFTLLNPQFIGRISWSLAGGQTLEEDSYSVEIPFDGQTVAAIAAFLPIGEVLIGTNLLRQHRLQISFPARTMLIEHVN